MAEDITDVYIATEAGDAGWQSLSALAAEQVDAKLPIESDDGTVKLDSPSANTFTVSTTGTENRLAVNERGMVGIGNEGSNPICLYINSVPMNATGLSGITCIPEIITADAAEVSAVKTQANLGSAVAANYFNHFVTGSSTGTGTAATMNGVRVIGASLTGTTKNVAFSTTLPADGEKNFSIETDTAPSVFNGDVRTSKVVGTAFSTDASIELGATAKISAGTSYYQLYSSGYHIFQSDGSQSRFTNDGDFLIGTTTPFSGAGAIPATKTVVVATGKKGIARWSAQETSSSATTDLYISCDYETSEVVFQSDSQVVLKKNDGSDYTPTLPNSICTKKTVDDKIWVGTTAAYNQISPKNPTTLYCLTD